MAHLNVRITEKATASTEVPIVAKKKQTQSQADATATAVDMNNQHFDILQVGYHSFVDTLWMSLEVQEASGDCELVAAIVAEFSYTFLKAKKNFV